MALTLADHAVQHDNLYAQGVVKIFDEENPILKYIPMTPINGDAYKYRVEDTMPGVEWRRVNQDYNESTGTLSPRVEPLYILGGETFWDNFIIRTQGRGNGAFDHKRTQWEMKSRALSREYSRAFFEGDDLVDPDEMPGLRRRLTGSQVLLAGTNGASLTLAMIDELIDAVIGGSDIHLFMHKTLRRKMTALITQGGTSATYMVTYTNVDGLGKQVMTYGGVPIHVIEDRGNANSILGFDETAGSSAVTSSIYAVNFGEDSVHGIFNGDGPPVDVRDLGEDQDSPGEKGRIEFFTGLVLKHPRGAARLRGVLAT
jgi:hypothetical protein